MVELVLVFIVVVVDLIVVVGFVVVVGLVVVVGVVVVVVVGLVVVVVGVVVVVDVVVVVLVLADVVVVDVLVVVVVVGLVQHTDRKSRSPYVVRLLLRESGLKIPMKFPLKKTPEQPDGRFNANSGSSSNCTCKNASGNLR